MSEDMQVCSVCGEEKALTDFPIDKRVKTGYKKVCKECFNEKYKDRNTKGVNSIIIIKEYLKENAPEIFKALSIQSIAEERDFIDVLVESINPKAEFLKIVNQYKEVNK